MQLIITVHSILILTFSWIHLINSNNSTHRKVIIIGAGSAGIAAATRLLENGVDDILVLEAQSRIGGRIHSIPFLTSYVDLGAEWAQQDEDSIVYSLAKSYDILKEAPSIKTHMMHSDGTCIDTKFARELTNFYASLKSKSTSKEEESMSVGEVFLKRYDSILDKYQSDPDALKICLDAINTFQNMVNVRQGSFSWFEPALFTSADAPKGKMLNWNGFGFKTILDIMMKKYPDSEAKSSVDGKIIFNKEVLKIDWTGHSNKVEIKCEDRSKFSSDYVIFTPSAGILKAKHDGMFNPKLPEEKVISLSNIGFGSLMKVFLHFPEKWWSDEFEGIILVWRQEDLNRLVEEFPHGPMKNNKSWISDSYSLTLAENNPNTIIAWFGGSFIPDLEKTSDSIIQDGVLYLLRKFYGKSYNISLPDKMIHTSWYENPYTRGVYSFESVECRSLDFNCNEALASPLLGSDGNPRVFFAGEATSPHHYGTVRGAIETGYDVADFIINDTKK